MKLLYDQYDYESGKYFIIIQKEGEQPSEHSFESKKRPTNKKVQDFIDSL